MKLRSHLKQIAAITALGIALFTGNTIQAGESKNYLLATASTGGTYYPV